LIFSFPKEFIKIFFLIFSFEKNRAEYDCFQIELSKNYGMSEWREDLKKVMLAAGLNNQQTVFLFSDTQVNILKNFNMLLTKILSYNFLTQINFKLIDQKRNFLRGLK